MNEELEYDAILIDTSIFDGSGLRLEKGLLAKLAQFKRSPVDLLMPDVICNEVKAHLEKKIKESRSSLEKAINDAEDHLFFDESALNQAKSIVFSSDEIEHLAKTRLDGFLINTGALVIECGDYLHVSNLLNQYFSNTPPFAESGKKKNEFPDAIALMAIEQWAEKSGKMVLAISQDEGWTEYCQLSKHIHCINKLADGLAIFNKATAPFAFLTSLEMALDNGTGKSFIDGIEARLTTILDGFTPDQDAESSFSWEPEGSSGLFKEFNLISHEFRIIEHEENFIVLEAEALIKVEVEGEFSISVYDSFDKEYVILDHVSKSVEEQFESEILITVEGDLSGPLENLEISDVEIVNPIHTINFGYLEPDFGEYE
jgi:hypothetical protein